MIYTLQNKKMEILAPAGSFDCLEPAVRCGCDAVYLGGANFSARGAAKNFDNDALLSAVRYCHGRGVKVYLAMNTLLRDDEMPQALDLAAYACSIGIDALIVQDLGLAKLLHAMAPELRLHASTQLSVHTLEGVRLLAELGFRRVVLSRELSRDEIREIAKSSPIELEVFVHGALCMSVSGQCYFSSVLGGRSGNRGLCAQPCRLPFSAPRGTGHDLSLKDLSIIDFLQELAQMGVCSAKIEGRMKRPEYVAAAVTACRESLDTAAVSSSLQDSLQSVFSRGGFTQGYWLGQRGKAMFGIRSKEDVTAATGDVFGALHTLYRSERQTVAIDIHMSIYLHCPCRLEICDNLGHKVCVEGKTPEPALHIALEKEKIRQQLNKTGGTPFFVRQIDISLDEGISLPLAEINRLRREALEHLLAEREKPVPIPFRRQPLVVPVTRTKANSPAVYAVFGADIPIPDEAKICSKVFLPLSVPINTLLAYRQQGFSIGIELPRGLFGREPAIREKLSVCYKNGFTDALVGNLGALSLARDAGMRCYGGLGLNIFNTYALQLLEELGLVCAEVSFELTLDQACSLGGTLPRGIFSYGRIPLMLTRNCPIANGTANCSVCDRRQEITDRRGIHFPVRCINGCCEILNSVPLFFLDRQKDFSTLDFHILRFYVENSVEIGEIFKTLQTGKKLKSDYTRGLYARGVE